MLIPKKMIKCKFVELWKSGQFFTKLKRIDVPHSIMWICKMA